MLRRTRKATRPLTRALKIKMNKSREYIKRYFFSDRQLLHQSDQKAVGDCSCTNCCSLQEGQLPQTDSASYSYKNKKLS